MFIHDAMNELVVCGETEVLAPNIRVNISRMERLVVGEEAVSGFQKQFEVFACHRYVCLILSFPQILKKMCSLYNVSYLEAEAEYNVTKNRFSDKLPSM